MKKFLSILLTVLIVVTVGTVNVMAYTTNPVVTTEPTINGLNNDATPSSVYNDNGIRLVKVNGVGTDGDPVVAGSGLGFKYYVVKYENGAVANALTTDEPAVDSAVYTLAYNASDLTVKGPGTYNIYWIYDVDSTRSGSYGSGMKQVIIGKGNQTADFPSPVTCDPTSVKYIFDSSKTVEIDGVNNVLDSANITYSIISGNDSGYFSISNPTSPSTKPVVTIKAATPASTYTLGIKAVVSATNKYAEKTCVSTVDIKVGKVVSSTDVKIEQNLDKSTLKLTSNKKVIADYTNEFTFNGYEHVIENFADVKNNEGKDNIVYSIGNVANTVVKGGNKDITDKNYVTIVDNKLIVSEKANTGYYTVKVTATVGDNASNYDDTNVFTFDYQFRIHEILIKDVNFEYTGTYKYDGTQKNPQFALKLGNYTFVQGVDYKVNVASADKKKATTTGDYQVTFESLDGSEYLKYVSGDNSINRVTKLWSIEKGIVDVLKPGVKTVEIMPTDETAGTATNPYVVTTYYNRNSQVLKLSDFDGVPDDNPTIVYNKGTYNKTTSKVDWDSDQFTEYEKFLEDEKKEGIPFCKNVGTYYVAYSFDFDNYETKTVFVKHVIVPAPLYVVADNVSTEYRKSADNSNSYSDIFTAHLYYNDTENQKVIFSYQDIKDELGSVKCDTGKNEIKEFYETDLNATHWDVQIVMKANDLADPKGKIGHYDISLTHKYKATEGATSDSYADDIGVDFIDKNGNYKYIIDNSNHYEKVKMSYPIPGLIPSSIEVVGSNKAEIIVWVDLTKVSSVIFAMPKTQTYADRNANPMNNWNKFDGGADITYEKSAAYIYDGDSIKANIKNVKLYNDEVELMNHDKYGDLVVFENDKQIDAGIYTDLTIKGASKVRRSNIDKTQIDNDYVKNSKTGIKWQIEKRQLNVIFNDDNVDWRFDGELKTPNTTDNNPTVKFNVWSGATNDETGLVKGQSIIPFVEIEIKKAEYWANTTDFRNVGTYRLTGRLPDEDGVDPKESNYFVNEKVKKDATGDTVNQQRYNIVNGEFTVVFNYIENQNHLLSETAPMGKLITKLVINDTEITTSNPVLTKAESYFLNSVKKYYKDKAGNKNSSAKKGFNDLVFEVVAPTGTTSEDYAIRKIISQFSIVQYTSDAEEVDKKANDDVDFTANTISKTLKVVDFYSSKTEKSGIILDASSEVANADAHYLNAAQFASLETDDLSDKVVVKLVTKAVENTSDINKIKEVANGRKYSALDISPIVYVNGKSDTETAIKLTADAKATKATMSITFPGISSKVDGNRRTYDLYHIASSTTTDKLDTWTIKSSDAATTVTRTVTSTCSPFFVAYNDWTESYVATKKAVVNTSID